MSYSFLVLSLLLLIPGGLIWWFRPDLRGVMGPMALASLPFALTERLFYPDYWEPRFLFDLVNVIGFGIEDILFVVGLAVFTSTAWAACANRTYVAMDGETSLPSRPTNASERAGSATSPRIAASVLAGCFAMVALIAVAGIPMIYGAPIIMTVIGGGLCALRTDLLVPSLGGALITAVVYSGLCLVLAALIPQVFHLDWKTDKFLNVFVLGVPVEEIVYAATSGFVATAFYPFVTRQRFAGRAASGVQAR